MPMRSPGTAAELIVEAVACSDGLDRQALARELDLPMGTVTSISAGLGRSGRLVEREPQRAAPGGGGPPPPVKLAIPGPLRTMGAVVWTEGVVRGVVCGYDGRVVPSGTFDLDPAMSVMESPGFAAALSLAAGRDLGPGPDVAAPDRIVVSVPAPYRAGI